MTVTILSHHRKISFISYRTGIGCGVILGLVVSKKKMGGFREGFL